MRAARRAALCVCEHGRNANGSQRAVRRRANRQCNARRRRSEQRLFDSGPDTCTDASADRRANSCAANQSDQLRRLQSQLRDWLVQLVSLLFHVAALCATRPIDLQFDRLRALVVVLRQCLSRRALLRHGRAHVAIHKRSHTGSHTGSNSTAVACSDACADTDAGADASLSQLHGLYDRRHGRYVALIEMYCANNDTQEAISGVNVVRRPISVRARRFSSSTVV